MKQSSILLATLFKFDALEKLCISNYRYIAYKNNIDYDYKVKYTPKDIFDNKYEMTICMNHFGIFTTANISSLLNKLKDNINIVLPHSYNMPIELIPCVIKNSDWSKNFINLYLNSKSDNLQQFIENHEYKTSLHILYTDEIQINNNKNLAIIKSYIDFSHKETTYHINKQNLNLGIL